MTGGGWGEGEGNEGGGEGEGVNFGGSVIRKSCTYTMQSQGGHTWLSFGQG